MKINQFGPLGVNPYKNQMNKVAASEKQAKADKVEISSAAKQLQEVSPITIARQEKVESLKQQVQSGTYHVDSEAIANSVYDFYFKK
ncbi:flagellar biosynthesis anti-sigma factor FlgM [Fredinandcohnia quinoae]|uniref:Negative regulator of flagellin synthesis n=1 Tax=Fredinandcohnia quinoae TaxID=2918902 RepID=A0AAW5E635_9BACI|nr:flagellar biosynthesis anti-sigma factor FlgM [Fredinandcohnia sp. SECRCQ15]MCH1625075.1 flagellar biosynthesis anti-sigma factor FlgM [Fredinandcohnia sp. SECRCQ15]